MLFGRKNLLSTSRAGGIGGLSVPSGRRLDLVLDPCETVRDKTQDIVRTGVSRRTGR